MKHSFGFFRIVFLSASIAFAPFSAAPANTECPLLPSSSLWPDGGHEGVVRAVLDKHHGDWSSYIAAWEIQLDRMKDTQARGNKAYVVSGSSKILIDNLPAYIGKLEKRIAVILCLKDENQGAAVAGQTIIPRKGDPARGETLSRTAGCFGCHGAHGVSNSRDVPNLAGQNDLYLVKQMKEFLVPHGGAGSSGVFARHSKVMDIKMMTFSDEDIWNIVAFYSDLSCAAEGQRGGAMAAPRKAVLCVECHGNKGYSVYGEIPNLAGQSESYLFEQLKALRMSSMGASRSTDSDQRHHLFMSQQVATLTNVDISALARFYSSLSCR